ncbi:MAG: aldo/keto reductase [Oscillospiraceae bacterium]|nr:aldo/keto reductase [Oscillospiraceae bacterium]
MEYRILGKTGLKISHLGFGGIPIQRIDAEGTKTVIRHLHEKGVNYIDTARGYTVSEEYLGYALEGIRQDFILATKSMARTREAMAADIETSLKNLRTDYIDLYQIHNPSAADIEQVQAPGGALEALMEAKAAGKIGHIGITLHPVDLFATAIELPWVETIMFPYNIVETQAEEMIRACREKNIGFIAMKPLAGGAIDDATLALRFIAKNNNVSVVIPGMATIAEADQNFAAVNDEAPLTAAEQEKIVAIRDSLGTQFCRRCNYCAPCSAGISIYSMFLMQGYHDRYDLQEWAKARYHAMPKKAGDCIDCGVCETRCPYNLPIRQMLKKVRDLFGE